MVVLGIPAVMIILSKVEDLHVGFALLALMTIFVAIPILTAFAWFWELANAPGDDVFKDQGARAKFVLFLGVLGAVGYTLVAPVWFGTFMLLAIAVVLFLPSPPGDSNFAGKVDVGRIVLAAAVVATAALTFSSVGPQRFDRIGTGLLAGRLNVAYIGQRGDDVIVAACNRTHDGFSTTPVVLEVDRAALGAFVLVRSGYAFYEGTDASLASMAAKTLGIDAWRVQSLPRIFADQFDTSGDVRNVCGATRLTVYEVKAALRAAAEDDS